MVERNRVTIGQASMRGNKRSKDIVRLIVARNDIRGAARNDIRGYRIFPLAREANMPPKQRTAKMMNDVCMLSRKSG